VAAGIHDGGVAHPNAEHKATREGLGERPLGSSHGHRIPRPDIRDAGADHQLAGGTQQQPGIGQRLAAEHLPGPQRAPAERFQFSDRRPDTLGGLEIQLPGPQPDATQPLGEHPSSGAGLAFPVHGRPPP
jgi:hypothetical protein